MSGFPYKYNTPTPKALFKSKWLDPSSDTYPIRLMFITWAFGECYHEKQKRRSSMGNTVELAPFEFFFDREKASNNSGLTYKQLRGLFTTCLNQGFLVVSEKSKKNKYTIYRWVVDNFVNFEGTLNSSKDDLESEAYEKEEEGEGTLNAPKGTLKGTLKGILKTNPKDIVKQELKKSGHTEGHTEGHPVVNKQTSNPSLASSFFGSKQKAAVPPASFPQGEEEIAQMVKICKTHKLQIEEKNFRQWLKAGYPINLLVLTLPIILERFKQSKKNGKPLLNHAGSMTSALQKNYAQEEDFSSKNRQFLLDFLDAHSLHDDFDVKLTHAFHLKSHKDFMYNRSPENFCDDLESTYQNFNITRNKAYD